MIQSLFIRFNFGSGRPNKDRKWKKKLLDLFERLRNQPIIPDDTARQVPQSVEANIVA